MWPTLIISAVHGRRLRRLRERKCNISACSLPWKMNGWEYRTNNFPENDKWCKNKLAVKWGGNRSLQEVQFSMQFEFFYFVSSRTRRGLHWEMMQAKWCRHWEMMNKCNCLRRQNKKKLYSLADGFHYSDVSKDCVSVPPALCQCTLWIEDLCAVHMKWHKLTGSGCWRRKFS